MLRHASLLTVALVLGAGLVTAAVAQSADPPRPPHHRMGLQERLGLSDDQMKAIREARERHRDEYRQIATALHQLQVDVRQLALNGGAESEIQAKNAELQRLWGQALDLRVKSLQEIAPILTPEQRAKFAQLGHHGGWGRRSGPPSS